MPGLRADRRRCVINRGASAMHFLVSAKIKKPRTVSNKDFYGVWQRESVAGREIEKTGAPIFKVAGEYEVVFIAEVEKPADLDTALHSLPIWKEGYQDMVEVTVKALVPYGEWGEKLDELVAG
jgi:muconolactone delta-isomerase